MSNKRTICGCR